MRESKNNPSCDISLPWPMDQRKCGGKVSACVLSMYPDKFTRCSQLRHRSFLFKEVKSQILAAYFSIGADHRSQSSIFARIRNRNEVTLPSFPASKIWPPSFVAMAGDNNDNFTHTYDPPIDLSLNQILNLHFNLLLNTFPKSSLNLPLSPPQNPALL